MSADPTPLSVAERFPLLHAPQRWEWGGLDAEFSTTLPPDHLVQSIHVVGFVGDRVVVCRHRVDDWFLPGGTREPDETVVQTVDRELAEEAGASRVGPLLQFGAHYCVADGPKPYRPHLPHPEKAWLWCVTDLVLDSTPTNPPDGEQVEEVRAVPLEEAQSVLGAQEPWYAELLTLAAEVRSSAET